MIAIEKPMLAGTVSDIKSLKYPVYCTPKLDGVRCLTVSGRAKTRTFHDFPNKHVFDTVSALPEGLDGEIIVEGKTFSEITHDVMREDGIPNFTYAVFDIYDPKKTYLERISVLKDTKTPDFVKKIIPSEIKNENELLMYEEKCISEGYEGVMIRNSHGPYKFGRSTEKEGYLLKLKRFSDSEAIILDIVEKMHNENDAKKDAFGRTKRSSAMENLVPAGTLGALKVRDMTTGVEFSLGSGFDDSTRMEIWNNKEKYIGKLAKYKYQKSGAKDLPRFPVFLGIRNEKDM